MSITLPALTAGFYLFSSLGYLLQVIFSERKMGRIALYLLTVALLAHTALLAAHIYVNPYPFIIGRGDFYFFASWMVAVLFLLLRFRYNFSGSGAFFIPLALLLFVFAIVFRGEYRLAAGASGNPWVLVHILFMSFAFAVFTVSFLVGVIYLIQERQLKHRRAGRFLTWFPPLETMDLIQYKALTIGFSLISIGILAGAALSKSTEGRFFTGDPRQIASLATWALYAVFLNIRMKPEWRGRRGMVLSVLGFAGVILTFLALEHRM